MKELHLLEVAATKPLLLRLPIYLRLSGPGWLQGAMTLGGGSAVTSLMIGAVYGYELLWLQPLAMLIGCIMLFALSHQTLSTGEEPYQAVRKHVHPWLAWAWAWAALVSSVIWGFSHYPLGAGMLEEIINISVNFSLIEEGGLERELYLFLLGLLIWAVCAYMAWNYGEGGRTVVVFELCIKFLSGMIIISFAWLVISAAINGQIDWSSIMAGYIPRSLPSDGAGMATIMAALGTAVGINMTFVYGYTLLHRQWGPEHRELAQFDIVLGLVLPYIVITSLISIAAAGALYDSDLNFVGKLQPVQAGAMFVDAGLGEIVGKLIFFIGVLGMVVGSLVMHMLCCGAAAAAIYGWSHDSPNYRLALLIPTPAVLGVFVWSSIGAYVVIPVAAICGALLPIAYVGWLILNNNSDYLQGDRPVGARALFYNICMGLCITVVILSFTYSAALKMGLV
jgi:Mn2+/Fe2+ NRAMP family transporter